MSTPSQQGQMELWPPPPSPFTPLPAGFWHRLYTERQVAKIWLHIARREINATDRR